MGVAISGSLVTPGIGVGVAVADGLGVAVAHGQLLGAIGGLVLVNLANHTSNAGQGRVLWKINYVYIEQ